MRDRVNFVNANLEEYYGSFSNESLLNSLEDWLEPSLANIKSVKDLQAVELYPLLLGLLTWKESQELENLAPYSIEVPSGSKIFIDYSEIEKPSISVKIQEIFGLHKTPKVLNNAVDLRIYLLSPAMRPIQITYDLESFWKNSYNEIRKELRGKYKRHYWPQDPYEAIATNKTKKNM